MDAKILIDSDKTFIVCVKVSLQCKECGHTWGVRLLGNGDMPRGSEKCTICNPELRKKVEFLAVERDWGKK